MTHLSLDKRMLCGIQGRLFENARNAGLDCPLFVEAFMKSNVAAELDSPFNRMQWAGEEYLIEELDAEVGGLPTAGETFGAEAMYWMGHVYRYWHYHTGESSARIFETADARTMSACWLAYHTLDVEAAIDRLREAADAQATTS